MTTTFDPGYKDFSISLSNGNLTASFGTTAGAMVRSTTSRTGGKYFFEITLTTVSANISGGVCNATETTSPSGGLGADAYAISTYEVSPNQGLTYLNGSVYGAGQVTSSPNGTVVSYAIDTVGQFYWVTNTQMRTDGKAWNGDVLANQNPATGAGGISFSSIAGPWFACFGAQEAGGLGTINFGATAFNQPVPTGFTAWDTTINTTPIVVICD